MRSADIRPAQLELLANANPARPADIQSIRNNAPVKNPSPSGERSSVVELLLLSLGIPRR